MASCKGSQELAFKRTGDPVNMSGCLAAAVLGIGGLGFVASKVDPGFADVFREAVVKVCSQKAKYTAY